MIGKSYAWPGRAAALHSFRLGRSKAAFRIDASQGSRMIHFTGPLLPIAQPTRLAAVTCRKGVWGRRRRRRRCPAPSPLFLGEPFPVKESFPARPVRSWGEQPEPPEETHRLSSRFSWPGLFYEAGWHLPAQRRRGASGALEARKWGDSIDPSPHLTHFLHLRTDAWLGCLPAPGSCCSCRAAGICAKLVMLQLSFRAFVSSLPSRTAPGPAGPLWIHPLVALEAREVGVSLRLSAGRTTRSFTDLLKKLYTKPCVVEDSLGWGTAALDVAELLKTNHTSGVKQRTQLNLLKRTPEGVLPKGKRVSFAHWLPTRASATRRHLWLPLHLWPKKIQREREREWLVFSATHMET